MYAFVIYDKRDGNIFIARDPLGVKPLCYAYDKKGRLFVASEIKQLSQFKEIDEIREFPSGHFYHKGKFTKYYSYSKEFNSNSEEKIKKDLKEVLKPEQLLVRTIYNTRGGMDVTAECGREPNI